MEEDVIDKAFRELKDIKAKSDNHFNSCLNCKFGHAQKNTRGEIVILCNRNDNNALEGWKFIGVTTPKSLVQKNLRYKLKDKQHVGQSFFNRRCENHYYQDHRWESYFRY